MNKTVLVLALVLTSISSYADAPRKSAWNPTNATNYALKYALSPNSNYVVFANDCTNFVSQIMRAGGWKDTATKQSTQDSSWYYTSKTSYAQTWSTAHGLRNRLNNGYELGAEKLSRSFGGVGGVYLNNKIAKGDVVFADWEVVFKKLCHFTKLHTIEGMTPCKTLTLTKP